jgi:hypothetical protein
VSPTIARPALARLTRACLLLGVLLLPATALAQSDVALARAGLDALVRLDYPQVEQTLDRLQVQNPHYPLLNFLRAGILWVKAEAQQAEREARIPAWVTATRAYQAAIEEAKAQIKNHPDDPRWRLALGMSQFFIARTYVEQHKVFKIYHYARAGRDTLRELIEEHPDMYDAYFSLGVYEYIAGSIPRGVSWLAALFDISGDRHLGIQYLQLATARAPVMAPEAARMLLAAAALQPEYVDNPCQYLALARQTQARYPQNPHFSGAYQMLHMQCGYPELALAENARARKVYLEQFPDMEKILDIIQVQTLSSMGDLSGVEAMRERFRKKNPAYWYLAMGQVYDLLGQRELARKQYHIIRDSGDEGKPDVLHNSDNEDWLLDQVDLYLRVPYHKPERAAYDPGNPFMLSP